MRGVIEEVTVKSAFHGRKCYRPYSFWFEIQNQLSHGRAAVETARAAFDPKPPDVSGKAAR